MADEFKIVIDLTKNIDPDSTIEYDPIYGGIYKGAYNGVKVSWTPAADIGLEGYNVYIGLSELQKYKVNKDGLVIVAELEFALPLFPKDIIFYFWIGKVVNGVETIMNEEPYTTYKSHEDKVFDPNINPIEVSETYPASENINWQMGLLKDRMLDDARFQLQNSGVDCDVYKRRWGTHKPFGVPCACTESVVRDDDDPNYQEKTDPDFQGRDKCPLCFGTGIVGGFYPPIRIKINFNLTPPKSKELVPYGLKVTQLYDAWTTRDPKLRSEDLVVRTSDGDRFILGADVARPPFRGVDIFQTFTLVLLRQEDIRQLVSLENINAALAKLQDPSYNPLNNTNDL